MILAHTSCRINFGNPYKNILKKSCSFFQLEMQKIELFLKKLQIPKSCDNLLVLMGC